MAGLAILAGGVLLAACGGSSNRAAGGASSSASIRDSVNATSCVTQVAALVKQEQAPMPDITPTTKVKMSKLKGKTVWYISPDQATGYALSVSQGLSAAGQAAGVKIQIFDGKDEPTLFASGMQEAVAQHAAAIFLYGFNPALVPQGLLAAKKAHIPVITALTGVGAPSNGTVFEAINENVRQEGVSMADFAAYHTGCKVNGATSYDPLYPSLVTERNTIQAELAKLCPKTCKVQPAQMSLGTMATALGPAIQSLVQRTPGLNTIFATFDQAATYEQPALARSGSSVKIVGTDGLPPNLQSIRSGEAQIADVAFVPPEYLGWLALDQVARKLLGMAIGEKGAPYALPVQTIDKANIGTSNSIAKLFPKLANYASEFKSLWGV